ncbi:MAG TPA: discoidin domain-containing protein [Sedimentisphaerales bacterium]|nr:discoidin domain-containing protein [Sedimentisphaerales bacterium]
MKKHICAVLLAGLAMSTMASATMVRQEWHTGVAGSRQAIIDFLVNLANPVPVPNVEVIQDASEFVGSRDNYVAKFYGWVTVPETGTYRFHYACDDYGMLYVSQDENMENAVEVAYVDGWAAIDEWNKYPTQHSAPMNLKKGQVMAVMAFFQEIGGGDNMDIGWTGPGLSSSITAPTYLTNYITHIPPTPSRAKSPSPEDGSTDVPMDAAISWGAGKFAATHDVYLGTVFNDVNSASRANPKGVLVSQNQTATSFDLKGVVDFGTTYYWRIDEVNAPPTNTIFKGKIWSFTTEPFAYPIPSIVATASSQSRADTGPQNTVNRSGLNADDQHSVELTQMWMTGPAKPHWIRYEFDKVYKLDEMLVWNSNQIIEGFVGFGAKNVMVEYSVDGENWTALEGVPEFAQAPGSPSYTANTTVDFGGVSAKFVKLTIDTNWGGVAAQASLAEVRILYVPVQARLPVPADDATNVKLGTEFNWRPGREATSHQVFFGADSAAVAAGTAAKQTVTDHRFTPSAMNFGTEYFWKVNEVGAAGTYEGDIWSFVSQEYAVIDNMDSYTDDEGSRIYEAWTDGVTNSVFGGSTVGYMTSPFAEKTIKNSGLQSMPLSYDNSASPFVSEAELAFGTPQNWTTNAADSLVLYVRGEAPAFVETASGSIFMNGQGADIWGTSDQFRYAYKTLTGNGTIVARVHSVYNTPGNDGWSKAGVMIRQSTEPGSTHAFMTMTSSSGNGASFQRRLTAAGDSTNTDATATVPKPYWVKVERVGDRFSGYLSPDGVTWTQLGEAQTITMTGPVLIGLAVTSHNANAATAAEFSDVKTTGNVAAGAWQMGEIGLAQPAGNSLEGLYLTVKDNAGKSKTIQNPDTAVCGRLQWQQWKIPLSEFTAAGVKMNAVKSIVIGVGNKAAPVKGGAGIVYIDDIGYGRSKQ